jgi:hypothetical protein
MSLRDNATSLRITDFGFEGAVVRIHHSAMAAIDRVAIDEQIPTPVGANVIKRNAFDCSVGRHCCQALERGQAETPSGNVDINSPPHRETAPFPFHTEQDADFFRNTAAPQVQPLSPDFRT